MLKARDVEAVLEGLGEAERAAAYLWAASCCMGCNFAELDETYAVWYGGGYMEALGRLAKGLGGDISCGTPVEAEGGVLTLSAFLLDRLRPPRREAKLSPLARALWEYLQRSGLAARFAERRKTPLGHGLHISAGHALPFGFLEHCFANHHRAVGAGDVTPEEVHEALRELARAGLIVRCSASGYDRFLSST